MAKRDNKGLIGKLLTRFVEVDDPLKARLEWLAE